jgi:hypothetical protein
MQNIQHCAGICSAKDYVLLVDSFFMSVRARAEDFSTRYDPKEFSKKRKNIVK